MGSVTHADPKPGESQGGRGLIFEGNMFCLKRRIFMKFCVPSTHTSLSNHEPRHLSSLNLAIPVAARIVRAAFLHIYTHDLNLFRNWIASYVQDSPLSDARWFNSFRMPSYSIVFATRLVFSKIVFFIYVTRNNNVN